MSWLDALLIALAGVGAGAINTVVGSGSLITFPTLVALGIPPVTANMSNSVGLVLGGVSGTWGYRRELRQARRQFWRFAPWSAVGAAGGAVLLLLLPDAVFNTVVVVLVGLSMVLVVIQPWVSGWVQRRRASRGAQDRAPKWVYPAIGFSSIYGGYFGAAQGVLHIAILGVGTGNELQTNNAIKNGIGTICNAMAALLFIVITQFTDDRISWAAAGLVALGSIVGGQLGAAVGRRLSPWLLRGVIVVIGVVAIVSVL